MRAQFNPGVRTAGHTSCQSGRPAHLLSRTGLHRPRLRLLAPVLLLASLLSPDSTAAPNSDRGRELLVKWKDGPLSAAAAAANARIGATAKGDLLAVGWQLVELPPDMTLDDGLQAYRSLDPVLLAEPDRAVPVTMPPAPELADPVEDPDSLPHRPSLHALGCCGGFLQLRRHDGGPGRTRHQHVLDLEEPGLPLRSVGDILCGSPGGRSGRVAAGARARLDREPA